MHCECTLQVTVYTPTDLIHGKLVVCVLGYEFSAMCIRAMNYFSYIILFFVWKYMPVVPILKFLLSFHGQRGIKALV